MASMNELYDALRNAHNAGDVAAARRLAEYIQELQAGPAAEAAPQKDVTIGEALKGGAKRLGSSILTGVTGIGGAQEAGEAGLARQQGITERSGSDFEKTKALWNEGNYLSSIGEGLSQIPTAIAEQAPNLAATAAGARTGAMAGTMLGGPVGGVIGGIGGAILPSFLAQSGSNIERQVSEGKPANAAAAYGAAIPQAGLDFITDKAIFGKLLGIPTARLGTEAAEKLAKESLLKTIGKGTAKGVILETPTEVTQQMLERLQAGLPLTDDDAITEYQQTAYQTALSGPMGVLGRVGDVSGARGQVEEQSQQRQAALAASSAERARQDAILAETKTGAQQAQYASEERAADIAGKALIEAADAKRQQVIATTEELLPEISQRIGTALSEVMGKLDSVDGVKELLNTPEIKSDKKAQQELQQYLNQLKRAADAEKKLAKLKSQDTSEEDRGFAETFEKAEINNYADEVLSQAFPQGFENASITELNKQKQELEAVAAGVKNKKEIPYYDAVFDRLDNAIAERKAAQAKEVAELRRRSQAVKAREQELALFDNDPMKKAAFEKGPAAWQAYQAQEQAQTQIPDEAFPIYEPSPEVSYEEKMAQLERVRSEQEAQDFQLEEQYPRSTAIEYTEPLLDELDRREEMKRREALGLPTEEETVNESIPAGQGKLLTQFGQPTAAALRGTADTSRISKTKPKRIDQRDALPSPSGETDVAETQAAVTRPLGDVGRTVGRPKARAETSEEIQPSPLVVREKAAPIKTVSDAVKAIQDVEAYWVAQDAKAPVDLDDDFVAEFEALKTNVPTEPKALAGWIKNVKAKTQQMKSMVDAAVQENAVPDEDMVSYDDMVNEPYDENDQYFESRKAKPKDIYGPERKFTVDRDGEPWTYFGPGAEVIQDNYPGAPAKVVEVIEERNEQPAYVLEIDTSNHPEAVDENGNQINTKRAVITADRLNRLNPPDTLESRKAKPKAKAERKPKDVSGKLREESTEPTTPELFAEKVSQWFNPVWYKNAVKNGMVNIVNGDINDSDLSDAIKEKYSTAKALFTPDGKAYFFIKNITKGNELGVFLHEIGEHKGLDNLIGKDRVKQLANRVRQMAEGKGSAREVAMAKQAIEMAEGQAQNDKEVIAYFGEIAVFNGVRPGAKAKPEFGKATGWITELWNSVKNAIKNLNLDPTKVTDKDIVDMLYGAARLEMGAVQTFEEQVGDPVPDAPEILASKARNPQWELTPAERAERAAKGLPESQVPQKYTMKERMLDTMGVKDTSASTWDKLGNAIVGPMFAIHRKATNYYGPESFYNKATGRLLGSLFLQHGVNANNLAFRALGKGTVEIDAKGFVTAVERDANLNTVNNAYNDLLAALVADGSSPAVAVQQASNMIFADRYKVLKAMGEKAQEEFTPAQMEEGNRLKDRHQATFDKWRNEYNKVRNNKVELLVSSGLYTRKDAEKLMKRLEYVPLYRVTGSEAADGVFMQGLLSAKKRQELDYDTKDYVVADVMTNIAKNEMWMYKQAIFNHATNLLIEQVEDMGNGKHVKVKNPNDKQTIAYMRNGELSYFRFDDVNDMASLYAIPVINNMATRILAAAGGVLRKGITLTPSFVYRQGWQDPMRAYMQSGTNVPFMKLVGESIRQQAKNFKGETKEAIELRNRGVVGAVEFQDSFDNAIDEMFGRDKTDPSLWNKVYKKLETMEKLAQNSDLAARAIVYKAALNEINPTTGMNYTEGEAALRAQMMLNYQHRGTAPLLRTLLSTIPFVNTQIQSDWRLVQALQGKIPGITKAQAKKLLAMKMLKMGLFTAAYAMTRTGDDDYENESDEQRNRNFIFDVGGVPLRIPVAPEYMLLKASVEQVTRKVMDAEFYEDRKLGHAVLSSIANLVLGPSDLTPAVIMPFIENAANYSWFTDRALVGQSLLTRAENLQFTEQTSELSKFISDQLQKTGFPLVQVSPIKIDNLLTGVFGTVARDAMFLSNELSDAITGKERPDLRLSQYAEVGTMFYNPKGTQRVADFYREYDKIMTAYSSYNSLKKTDPERAQEYLAENRKLIMLRGPAEATKKKLDANRQLRARIVARKDMSGPEKEKRLEEIIQRSNEIATEPTKMLRRRMEE